MNNSILRMVAAVLGALAVALGAFGAHSLDYLVPGPELAAAERTRLLEIWEVGVRYQMYHALALLALSMLPSSHGRGWSAKLLILGTVIFSGCLYLLVISGVRLLGAVVPLGGLFLIAGWVALAWESSRRSG